MGNKKLEKNLLIKYEISYDKTEEEIVNYAVKLNGGHMNRFIDRDRTQDLIKGVDVILN